MILRRGKKFGRFAVANGVKRNLHAFKKFLDDDFRARRAETFCDENFVNRFTCLYFTGANQNALAEREAVGFHSAFAVERRRKFFCGGGIVESSGTRGRDAVFLHEVL